MTKTVLILGGYGVFGGRLAKRLARDEGLNVIIAGRSLAKANAFAQGSRLQPAELDIGGSDFSDRLAALAPDIIIDAAGPFQDYAETPYRVAQLAIKLGAHYLDLSDEAAFTAGIACLDAAAQKAGVTVLSGVSSVPAISSVVANHLIEGIEDVHSIESVILPGNRAPRGVSVMRSILSQVGRPLRLWQANRFVERPAWSDLRRYDLDIVDTPAVRSRRASLIGAPDLDLFPQAFKARSVTFRAGLELRVMQYGLWLLHWLPRWRLVRSVASLVQPLKWVADRLESFGRDRGGMQVEITGRTQSDQCVRRTWTLIVEQGDGPHIPGIPAQILVGQLLNGDVHAGARACLREFSMEDLAAGFAGFHITTGQQQRPIEPMFAAILEGDFRRLPQPVQDLHQVLFKRRWKGTASVERGTGFLSRCAGWMAGFPPASDSVPVEVEMTRTANGEVWQRQFGPKSFRSVLSRDRLRKKTVLAERFGWMSFLIDLGVEGQELQFPVIAGRLLGIPLPTFLLPRSETREFADARGNACFDVRITAPFCGLIAHYQGQLSPAEAAR